MPRTALSRRYAYQVLIIEELARQGVETVFLNAPSMETPEDHLLVQFQGMIAEYERAQILERSRRGKRHRARRGEVAVLGGAPYGYRYHKKTQDSDAFYEIVEPQASVVRDVYRHYTEDHMSIGAIARKLNERGVPTSSGRPRWERSVVWAMLRNPAYKGRACFGKTRVAPRQRVRPPRGSDGFTGTQQCRSRAAARRLDRDPGAGDRQRRDLRPRRRAAATEQGLLQAQDQNAQRLAGARGVRQMRLRAVSHVGPNQCPQDLLLPLPGFRRWRHLNGPLCDSRPVRQDLLDDIVWTELVRLLEDPALVKAEIDRRLEAARVSDPNQQREDDLRHRLIRVRKGIDRLVTAYQEELITIDELRDRTPELRRQEQALHRELQSAVDRARDRNTYLRLAETLTGFLARLRSSAETLDIAERQRIVRLLVKEILVTEDKITIRHSIPISGSPGGGPNPSKPGNGGPEDGSYLLRSGRNDRPLWRALRSILPPAIDHDAGFQPLDDQPDQPLVPDPMLKEPDQPVPRDGIEEPLDVTVDHLVDLPPVDGDGERVKRIVRSAPRSEPVAEAEEGRLVNRRQDDLRHRLLDDFVLQRGNAERSCPAVRLGYLHPPDRRRPVRSGLYAPVQVEQPLFQPVRVLGPCHAVHPRRGVPLQRMEGPAQRVRRDMMQERRQLLPRLPRCSLTYPLGGLGHAFPALRPARAFASRIPLGRGPSLRELRGGSRPFVRPLRRYYGPVRLLHPVHLRLRFSFPSRPRHDCRGGVKTSQVPVVGVHTCMGSQTPRSSPAPRHVAARTMLPSTDLNVSALRMT